MNALHPSYHCTTIPNKATCLPHFLNSPKLSPQNPIPPCATLHPVSTIKPSNPAATPTICPSSPYPILQLFHLTSWHTHVCVRLCGQCYVPLQPINHTSPASTHFFNYPNLLLSTPTTTSLYTPSHLTLLAHPHSHSNATSILTPKYGLEKDRGLPRSFIKVICPSYHLQWSALCTGPFL